jgi:hypothetical protein
MRSLGQPGPASYIDTGGTGRSVLFVHGRSLPVESARKSASQSYLRETVVVTVEESWKGK